MVKPELYWHTNTVGSLALIDAVRAAGVPRLVFSSTAAVYGNPTELPIPETAVKAPTNTYGATKLAVDMALTSEAIAHGLAAVSLRYFNVAGAYLRRRHRASASGTTRRPTSSRSRWRSPPAGGRSSSSSATTTPPSTAPASATTSTSTTWPAPTCWRWTRPPAGQHRIYNLGNGNGFTNRQVVDVVREVTGHPLPVEVAPRREGDPAELVASSALAREELGWVPREADPARHGRRRLGVLPHARRWSSR